MRSNTQQQKNGPKPDAPMPDSTRVHHWNIEPPNGPVSAGVCDVCGESRDFKNSYEISSWDNRKKHNPRLGAQPGTNAADKKNLT
jgi:hypothetical protein